MNAHRIRSLPLIRRCATPSPEGEGFKTVNCRRCHFDRSGGFNQNAAEKSPAVGEPPPASGLARVRKRHFVSTRLPRRYAPRNDSGDMCVRLFYTVIPFVLRCHFDRSEGFNPNVAEKSPAVKVFRPCTTLPVPHRVTYYNMYDFTVLIFTFPQKKETVG